jgi:ADP-heptose:LPS heptosyltransferase
LERILLIRIDALGDTILTTPLINELKRHRPDAEITVLASQRGHPALEGSGDLQDIIIFDHEKVALDEARRITIALAGKKFNAAIIVSEKIWGYILPFWARIPLRIGFTPGISSPFKAMLCRVLLTHRVPYLNVPERAMGEHEVERQKRLLLPLGINGVPGPLRLHLNKGDKEDALATLKDRGFSGEGRLLALHLSEKWVREGYNELLIVTLLEKLGSAYPQVTLLLTYGAGDEGLARKIMEVIKERQVITFSDSSFRKWSAMLSLADLVITMDTSASHVAAAFGVPVIDVFPEQYYEHCAERWHPWKVPYRLVMKKNASCCKSEAEVKMLEDELISEILAHLEDTSLWKN